MFGGLFFEAFAPTIIFWFIIIVFGKRMLMATIKFLKRTKGYILLVGFLVGHYYLLSNTHNERNSIICIIIWALFFVVFVIVRIVMFKRKRKEKRFIASLEKNLQDASLLRAQERALNKNKPTYEELEQVLMQYREKELRQEKTENGELSEKHLT